MDEKQGITSFKWQRVCRTIPSTNCAHRIPEIRGTEGITGYPLCNKAAGVCIEQATVKITVPKFLLRPVVASFKFSELTEFSPALVDILPSIMESEIDILFSWARDYTERNIPWLVTNTYRIFALWKQEKV